MAAFHFLRPEWLWGLLPLVGILVFLAKRGANAHVWESVCDAHLLPHVLVGTTGAKSRSPIILLGLGWTLALVALAGPVWSQLPQPVFRAESALVIVLDVSRSMDAQDVAPTRLTRAKHKILDILQARQEGQTALVIFAGESFVVSPLTDDSRTMKTLVQTLETNLMPVQGSRPALALKMGNELLEQAGIPGLACDGWGCGAGDVGNHQTAGEPGEKNFSPGCGHRRWGPNSRNGRLPQR
jgi:Ca-activated chloride channel family protein